jgi:hypothetical protein
MSIKDIPIKQAAIEIATKINNSDFFNFISCFLKIKSINFSTKYKINFEKNMAIKRAIPFSENIKLSFPPTIGVKINVIAMFIGRIISKEHIVQNILLPNFPFKHTNEYTIKINKVVKLNISKEYMIFVNNVTYEVVINKNKIFSQRFLSESYFGINIFDKK